MNGCSPPSYAIVTIPQVSPPSSRAQHPSPGTDRLLRRCRTLGSRWYRRRERSSSGSVPLRIRAKNGSSAPLLSRRFSQSFAPGRLRDICRLCSTWMRSGELLDCKTASRELLPALGWVRVDGPGDPDLGAVAQHGASQGFRAFAVLVVLPFLEPTCLRRPERTAPRDRLRLPPVHLNESALPPSTPRASGVWEFQLKSTQSSVAVSLYHGWEAGIPSVVPVQHGIIHRRIGSNAIDSPQLQTVQ